MGSEKEATHTARQAKVRDATVTLSHGSGGKAMRDLVSDIFLTNFDNPALAPLEDQARIDLAQLGTRGDRLAFTTDSYVVNPLFFPGADIGRLAVNGTVNDLAVGGARPLYLSCAVILEEGLPVATLRRVVASMREAASAAGVVIATGDTKVVERGSADKLFVNTAGIGVIPRAVNIAAERARPGDVILLNGGLGEHGVAILNAREGLGLSTEIGSDCQPLHGLVEAMLAVCPDLHCLRDATRGGLATVLNEFAQSASVGMQVNEAALPVRDGVKGVCELLGLDPLYLANEGKLVAIAPREANDALLEAMRAHPAGRESVQIGEVTTEPAGSVVLRTAFGGERLLDMLIGDQLPRIC